MSSVSISGEDAETKIQRTIPLLHCRRTAAAPPCNERLRHTVIPPAGQRWHDSAHPAHFLRLNGDESNFLTQVQLTFDGHTYEPRIDDIRVYYDLKPFDQNPAPDNVSSTTSASA